MNKEELKSLVKKYFNLTENITSEQNEEVKEESFASAKLADGTEISNKEAGDFAVGQTLYVITEAGDEVIAPSGEHTTESGISITVDGEGKITGVHRPDEAGEGSLSEEEYSKEEAPSEESTENKTELAEHDRAEITVGDEPIEAAEHDSIKEEIVEAILETVAPEIEALKAKLAEHEEKMAEHDAKLSEHMSAPAAEPVEEAKAKFSATLTKKDNVWAHEPFNQKKAQYEMILKAKQNKLTKTKN